MHQTSRTVVSLVRGHAPEGLRCLDLLEQRGLIPFFDPEDGVQTVRVQRLDVGGIRTQAVFGHKALEVWMVLPERDEEACGRVACPIVFCRAILVHNRCRHQRDHGTHVRMPQRCAHHLVSIGV
jgi:hypothetical protein